MVTFQNLTHLSYSCLSAHKATSSSRNFYLSFAIFSISSQISQGLYSFYHSTPGHLLPPSFSSIIRCPSQSNLGDIFWSLFPFLNTWPIQRHLLLLIFVPIQHWFILWCKSLLVIVFWPEYPADLPQTVGMKWVKPCHVRFDNSQAFCPI